MQNEDWILENIRSIRVSKGIKSENIAMELGISQGEYSKIENGNRENYFSYLPRIAEILAVDFHDLVASPNLIQNNYGNLNDQAVGNAKNVYMHNKELYEKLLAELKDHLEDKTTLIQSLQEQKNYFEEKYYRMKERVKKLE